MSDFRDYFDGLARLKAPVKFARVESRNPDGTYEVSEIATGSIRRVSRSNPNEEYAPGSWVTVGSPSASRSVIGSQDMILTRAPGELRGMSATTPDRTSTIIPSAAIFRVVPDPIELVAGGASVAAVIYGAGFLTDAPVYSDFGINDSSAPLITPTRIDIDIAAGGGVAAGGYDLSVGTATKVGGIQVAAAPVGPGPPVLTATPDGIIPEPGIMLSWSADVTGVIGWGLHIIADPFGTPNDYLWTTVIGAATPLFIRVDSAHFGGTAFNMPGVLYSYQIRALYAVGAPGPASNTATATCPS